MIQTMAICKKDGVVGVMLNNINVFTDILENKHVIFRLLKHAFIVRDSDLFVDRYVKLR